ncbi:transcriptional regulator, partial [Escherichia coli]|nr:transcriptional regulator [Escherichia coli]
GMDQDEVLRLKQISGLTELFLEEDFSDAWTVR